MQDSEGFGRKVSAPPPRASSLLRQNRPIQTQGTERHVAAPPPRATGTAIQVVPDQDFPTVRPTPPTDSGYIPASTAHVLSAPTEAVRKQGRHPRITFDIPTDLRTRVRAMFTVTHFEEGEDTFSAMLCNILARECTRREAEYNGGERFKGGERPIPPGRRPSAY